MNNIILLSKRKFEKWPSYDLVYEWEDIISKDIRLIEYNKYIDKKYIRILPSFLRKIFLPNKLTLYFEMSVYKLHNPRNFNNFIPWIIDFYIKEQDLAKFYAQYNKCPLIFISSKEVNDILIEKNCPINHIHLPLSISDIYRIESSTRFDKVYDLVLMGRQNPVLVSFLNKYAKENKDFYYVYRKQEGNIFNYYTSRGEFLGNINTREQYINLMKKAKSGLYSTPGMDGGEKRTNGYNQVTPRFLELIACGCHVIARYNKNPDTTFFELDKFSASINNYEEFKKKLDYSINNPVNMELYASYLNKHYTSERVKTLKEIILKL